MLVGQRRRPDAVVMRVVCHDVVVLCDAAVRGRLKTWRRVEAVCAARGVGHGVLHPLRTANVVNKGIGVRLYALKNDEKGVCGVFISLNGFCLRAICLFSSQLTGCNLNAARARLGRDGGACPCDGGC